MHRLLTATALLLAAALPASADAVVQKAKAVSKAGPSYVYDLSVDDGEDEFLLTIDQSKPSGKRVVTFAPALAQLTGETRKKADKLIKNTGGDIWCSAFAENIPADAKRVSETSSSATYTFTPVPGSQTGNVASAYKFLQGTATIDKATGAILSYEMASPKAFKPVAVAKVDALTMKVACKPAPDGRTHVASLNFALKGSAMMQSLDQSEIRKITNLKAVAKSAAGMP